MSAGAANGLDFCLWTSASDIEAQAIVGFQGSFGSARRALETALMTQVQKQLGLPDLQIIEALRAIDQGGHNPTDEEDANDGEAEIRQVVIQTWLRVSLSPMGIYIVPLIRSIGCKIGVTIPSGFISDRCS
jgi:hypothetical protein